MQKLHLVGFTADFDGLIFSARKGAKSGSFVVPLDGRLLKQIAEAQQRRDGGPVRGEEHRLTSPRLVRPESALNPREMQDRIRSGWSVDEVAAEAGVDLDWVRRFAAPVLAEVRQVIERVRDVVYDKPRFGLSSLPLGASVRRNVLDRGVRLLDEELDEGWSAYQLDEDAWVVRFAYTSRGRLQEAEWLFDVETEELVSRNRLASQLGHVARGRKRSSAPVTSSVPKPSSATRKAAAHRRSTVTRPAPATAGPKKAAPKKAAPKKAAPKKAAPKKAAPKKAAPKKVATAVSRSATTRRPLPAARQAAATNGAGPRRSTSASTARPPARTTPARPAPSARTPSAPRKKAATRPTKKPDKERVAALVEAPMPSVRPRPEPTPPPMAPAPERRPSEPPRPAPPELPARQQDWPTDPGYSRWEPPEAGPGPLPPPGPAPVPEAVREAVASPIGEDFEPPRPGAAEVDPVSGVARIDSRRMSRYVSAPPPRNPLIRADVARAGTPEAPGPRRPRRTEPLRGR